MTGSGLWARIEPCARIISASPQGASPVVPPRFSSIGGTPAARSPYRGIRPQLPVSSPQTCHAVFSQCSAKYIGQSNILSSTSAGAPPVPHERHSLRGPPCVVPPVCPTAGVPQGPHPVRKWVALKNMRALRGVGVVILLSSSRRPRAASPPRPVRRSPGAPSPRRSAPRG